MRLPPFVIALGFAGLLPMLVGPVWWAVSPQTVPARLDQLWVLYGALIASFMAGTFWGFALPAVEGTEGLIGTVIASLLMLLTWVAVALPYKAELYGLMTVFLLSLLADFWRERTLGSVPGYFALRTALTLGAFVALGWRSIQL